MQNSQSNCSTTHSFTNTQTHRELEEDEATSSVLQDRFESSDDSTPPEVELEKQNVSKLNKELNQLCAIPGMIVPTPSEFSPQY